MIDLKIGTIKIITPKYFVKCSGRIEVIWTIQCDEVIHTKDGYANDNSTKKEKDKNNF